MSLPRRSRRWRAPGRGRPLARSAWTRASSRPVRDPDVPGADIVGRPEELVPVGVVGQDQGQLDPALSGALLHRHPPGSEADDGVGEAPCPAVGDGTRGCYDDLALELVSRAPLAARGRRPELAQGNPMFLVKRAQAHQGAVDVDRPLPAGGAQMRDHPLRLAERVGTDDVAALGEHADRRQKPRDLAFRRRMAEDREPEGRFP